MLDHQDRALVQEHAEIPHVARQSAGRHVMQHAVREYEVRFHARATSARLRREITRQADILLDQQVAQAPAPEFIEAIGHIETDESAGLQMTQHRLGTPQ